METLDSFNTEDSKRIDKIISELKRNYPEINWQTEWNDYEDINGNPTSYISLIVPSTQYEEAERDLSRIKGGRI